MLTAALPAVADKNSVVPTWWHNSPYSTCGFFGGHGTGAGDSYALGLTEKREGCQYLRVRMKAAQSDPPFYTFETLWKTSPANAPYVDYYFSGYFAKSSEHRGYNGFLGSWSTVRRPHPR